MVDVLSSRRTLYVVCGPPSSGKTAFCERAVRAACDASPGAAHPPAVRSEYREWCPKEGAPGGFELHGSVNKGKRRAVARFKEGAVAVYVDDQHWHAANRRQLVDDVRARVGDLEACCLHFLPDGGEEQVRWAYECALAEAMAHGVRRIGAHPHGPPELLLRPDLDRWFRAGRPEPGCGGAEDAGCYSQPVQPVRLPIDGATIVAAAHARDGLFFEGEVIQSADSARLAKLRDAALAWARSRPGGGGDGGGGGGREPRIGVALRLGACGDALPARVREFASLLAPRPLYYAAQARGLDDEGGATDEAASALGVFLAARHAVPPHRALCVSLAEQPGASKGGARAPWSGALPAMSADHFLRAAAERDAGGAAPPVGAKWCRPLWLPQAADHAGAALPELAAGAVERFEQHGRVHGVCAPLPAPAQAPPFAGSAAAHGGDAAAADGGCGGGGGVSGSSGGGGDGGGLLPPGTVLLTEAELVRAAVGVGEPRELGKALAEYVPPKLTERSRSGLLLSCALQGGQAAAYRTSVHLHPPPVGPGRLFQRAACSCPVGARATMCKHAFYLMLAYARDPASFGDAPPPPSRALAAPAAPAAAPAPPPAAAAQPPLAPNGPARPPRPHGTAHRVLPNFAQLAAKRSGTAEKAKQRPEPPTPAADAAGQPQPPQPPPQPRAKKVRLAKPTPAEVIDLDGSSDDGGGAAAPPRIARTGSGAGAEGASSGRGRKPSAPRGKGGGAPSAATSNGGASASILTDPIPTVITGAYLRDFASAALERLEGLRQPKRPRAAMAAAEGAAINLPVLDCARGAAQLVAGALARTAAHTGAGDGASAPAVAAQASDERAAAPAADAVARTNTQPSAEAAAATAAAAASDAGGAVVGGAEDGGDGCSPASDELTMARVPPPAPAPSARPLAPALASSRRNVLARYL